MRDYYRRWLSVAVTHSWGKTETVSTIAGIVVPATAKNFGDAEAMLDLAWQVPLCVFLTLFVVRVVLAPWWIHQEQGLAFAGLTEQREKTFNGTVTELKEQAATQHAELLNKIGAIAAERDSAVASLTALYNTMSQTPASVLDIKERLEEFSEEGNRLVSEHADEKACDEWYQRLSRFIYAAIRRQYAKEFPEPSKPFPGHDHLSCLDECRSSLFRLIYAIDHEWTNRKFTEAMLADHPAT